ncbi:unnamed protein product [Alopecurus aequalis]
MPQLQENLCSLLHHARQEASIMNPLRVMVIKDMLYLINVEGLAEHASPAVRSQRQLAFVDLQKSCCELLANPDENETVAELVSIQDRFSSTFPVQASVEPGTTKQKTKLPERATDVGICISDRNSLVVDLSAFVENTQIALPSLNGWLLGYPITYLLRNESAEAATRNLSKHSLHIYRIYVTRIRHSDTKQSEEELLSFSVPCNMSVKREEEPWAKSFLAHMNDKLERCSHVWASVRLEIEVFQSQSGVIVL